MTSGLFASYDDDFNENMRQVRKTLSALHELLEKHRNRENGQYDPPPMTGPLSRSQMIQTAQQGMSNLRDLITSMTYECNDIQGDAAQAAKRRVEECKRTVVDLAKEISRLQQELSEAERLDLLACGKNISLSDETQRQRAQMIGNSEKLREGTSTLKRAEAFLGQANEVGHETLKSMRMQTEQIHHIHTVVHDVDNEVTDSRRIINSMRRTAITHKLYLIGVIFLLVVAIVVMFLYR